MPLYPVQHVCCTEVCIPVFRTHSAQYPFVSVLDKSKRDLCEGMLLKARTYRESCEGMLLRARTNC